ncbi:hypothetical protein GL177_20365 [Vibrio toranzoniae]|uniref:papain-like cysteine protease family protein n=1 Tax=Vibrio TaxID=662 RepID=UPI001376D359|nr:MULTISPECIES: papain-like cysteine protease family protein [Vibrio]MDA0146765.1 hypothetical protein [Vibrio sp. RW]NAZ55656.1 hypothetical protein [Vibrio toranzoniae]
MNIFRLIALTLLVITSFTSQAIERQLGENWCWAASIQDVLRQANIYQSQQQIATVLDGRPIDRPAHVNEVVGLLNYYQFRAWVVNRPASPNELYQTLASGWKLIAFVRPSNGAVGHFIVLQRMNNSGGIEVSDPWTGQTYVNSLNQLYSQWRWGASVVVGAPM